MKPTIRTARWLGVISAAVCFFMLVLSSAGVLSMSVNGPGTVQGQDDASLEIGVEYINNFHGVAGNWA